MPQYYSKTVYIDSAGGESVFALDFDYQNQDDVVVTINGVETTDFTWTSASTISLNTPTTSGDDIALFRRTDLANRSVDFINAAELTEADLDASAQQVFDAMQEVKDVAADSFTPQPDGSLSLGDRKLLDVADPTLPSDAANKRYVDGVLTSNAAFVTQAEAARDAASVSEANAATSEANAATSEANAATSEVGAAQEYANAVQLLDNLDAQVILPALPTNELKFLQVTGDATNTQWVDLAISQLDGRPASDYALVNALDAVEVKADQGISDAASVQTNVDSLTATVAGKASIVSVDSLAASKANTSGTYASLRAQATTKSDVGLSNVANYGVSTSVSNSSTTTYATASAVKLAYDKAGQPLSKTLLFSGSTTGDISLAQPYTNFRFLVFVVGETDWASSVIMDPNDFAVAWSRSGSKYVHAVGADGYIEILQSGTTTTFLNMGASLRGVVSRVYGVGKL